MADNNVQGTSETKNVPEVKSYSPSEIINIYSRYVGGGMKNDILWLRGIYSQRPNQNPQWAAFYDELRDPDITTRTSITLKIGREARKHLKPNSLVLIGGLMKTTAMQNSTVQLVMEVTRFEVIKDVYVTQQDLLRSEIRIAKTRKGFRNVDKLLEDKLFRDERPRVALVFATTSITMLDFNAGVHAAAVKIDFQEYRQSFANAPVLAQFLRNTDTQGYDVVALVRGGGSGIEALDAVEVLQAVATMNTPVICAIGHVGEELFMKSVADMVAPTPNGLGQYFSEMVERVAQQRNRSRAALVEEVRKQFQKELESSNNKNKELLKQVGDMTKQAAAQTKTFNNSMKAQKESFDKLAEQNRATTLRLEAEQRRSRELELKMSGSRVATWVAVAATAAAGIVGFLLAMLLR